MKIWQRFEVFYLFAKAFLVSLFMFAAMTEVKHNGWTRQAIGNFVVAFIFTGTTFLILHIAKLKGLRQ